MVIFTTVYAIFKIMGLYIKGALLLMYTLFMSVNKLITHILTDANIPEDTRNVLSYAIEIGVLIILISVFAH